MAKITYIEARGVRHVVEAAPQSTVMEAAVRNAVPGIDADCGGACSCATCHVYLDGQWAAMFQPPSQIEEAMLEMVDDLRPESRLSCQLKVTEDCDGLIVNLPASQK